MTVGSTAGGAGLIGSYAAVGDSFTEGVGDPARDGALIGWADRLAAMLAGQRPGHELRYANLAVRGRLLDQIIEQQVPRAKEFAPDLVSFCAGGNDILRPGGDPDSIAVRLEAAVADLVSCAGTVLLFTGFDTRGIPLLRHLRGRIATYTAHVRSIADRYDCPVVDLWSLRTVQDRRAWHEDRLHLSPVGHAHVALRAAHVLGLDVPAVADPLRRSGTRPQPRAALSDDIHWAREHFLPWVARHLRGESSGDQVEPKRPDLLPL
ncbi:SGNH/GDSL hydrolase family protein [Streptomyces sp. A3M-1-3]|uniref:SGNH/GDSL hydrolase family protein n=1 Tax=Streptomyces sp. A3M-1-3 TaxID=2962044 RepID=UPI0020B70734|nr:SGNH/GDSL hydrolase family protein [Streptomyces sp. A3M-1-3]MCP3822826.1 SGNH/GDSL hydrolase family protein [Streptomyces sp. A3M-1-3]